MDRLKGMIAATAAAGLLLPLGLGIYWLLVKIFWKKATAKVNHTAAGNVRKKIPEVSEESEEKKSAWDEIVYPYKPVAEFDVRGETVSVTGRYGFDDKIYQKRLGKDRQLEIRYKKRDPQRFWLKGEYLKRCIPFIIFDIFAVLGAILAEVLIFTYNGMLSR